MKENLDLTSQHQQQVTEVKKNVYHVAREQVTEEKATNEERHTNLKHRLLVLQQQLGTLRRQRNDILEKRKELKINLSINEEELEEYRAVGSLQKAKIKNYKDKIDQLKIVINQEVTKRENSVAALKKQKQQEHKGLRTKLTMLERQQEEMKVRVEQLKVLGETILLQRE